jgi:hypothetical protein
MSGFFARSIGIPNTGSSVAYVGVPPKHPWHGAEYTSIDAEVHGGLTFSGEGQNFRYLLDSDKGAVAWWVGFDCAHAFDLVPSFEALARSLLGRTKPHPSDHYRDLAYVRSETCGLAEQALARQRAAH